MNCVAHLLVKVAHSMSGLGEWHITPPEFINQVLDSDSMSNLNKVLDSDLISDPECHSS